MDKAAPLSLGILCGNAAEIQDWQWRLLDRLAGDDRFVFAGRLQAKAETPKPSISPLAAMILSIDSAILAGTQPYANEHIQAKIKALPSLLTDSVSMTAYTGTAPPSVDIILRLGPESLTPTALPMARYGEWSLSFADCNSGAVDWTAFETVHKRAPTLAVDVVARTAEQPDGVVIACADYNPKFSAARTGAFVQEKSVLLLLKALTEFAENRCYPSKVAARNAVCPAPSSRAAFSYSMQLVSALGDHAFEAIRLRVGRDPSYWQLSIGKGDIDRFDPATAIDVQRADENMADPFLFSYEGKQYIFYEADTGGGSKAWISVGRLEGATFVPMGEVLRRDYHLSYPHVFRHGAEIFMIPETQQSNRLEVWRCTDFPFRWELHATGLEGMFPADSNLFAVGDRWWLFTNLSDHHSFQEHSSELYIFQVDGPDLRSIEPHRKNPVVIGSSTARNAGPVIRSNGHLYRPSQINAHGTYGYGLNIFEIDRLDVDCYQERIVRRITPDFRSGLIGIHHISFSEGRYVFDSCRSRC